MLHFAHPHHYRVHPLSPTLPNQLHALHRVLVLLDHSIARVRVHSLPRTVGRLVLQPPRLTPRPSASLIVEASADRHQLCAAPWTRTLGLAATRTLTMILDRSPSPRNLAVVAQWVSGALATPGWEKEEVMVEKDPTGDVADALLD